MVLKHAKAFVGRKFSILDIAVTDGKISAIGENLPDDGQIIDCTGRMVWPGLFDIHTHGCFGYDFSTSTPEEILEMCIFYARHGVTSVLATTMTSEPNQYARAMENIRRAMESQSAGKQNGARIQGIHMEGPFFGPAKKGAHDERYLCPVSQELVERYHSLSGGAVRLLALDPGLPGAIDFIRDNKNSFVISIAHTDCDYKTARAAAEAGASHVTHLFNAMRPLLHREPGVAGAAFESGLDAEIICDGVHVHPAIVRMMFAAMPEHMILISDSINPTGLPDGCYEAGGLPIEVTAGRAYLTSGTLAGSTITLFDAVRKAVDFHIPLEQALESATSLPAKSVGLADKTGEIACGRAADLLVVDDELHLEQVMLGGNFININ